ncbi:MAG: glycosyltransferase family 39 protein [Desulfatiglandales bacterium]
MRNRTAILIIGLGFVIRLFCFQHTYIVNPDGVLYIHQARAIYYGLTDSVLTCSMGYLSNYPILIVVAYKIFGDWVVAAKSVSLFFGTITLVPVYLLLKRFFRREITLLATLIFSLIPVFIDKSVDLVRDPVYWFFSLLGLYLFVSQIEERNHLRLIVSSLSFLIAAWARIEAILFILVSFVYLIFVTKDRKLQRTSVFAMPLVLVLLFGIFGLMIFNMPVNDLHRGYEATTKFTAPMTEYRNLRESLTELMNQPLEGSLPAFLHKARHLVWLIGLGTLVTYGVRAYFYPFFLIFIIGLGGIWGRLKKDDRVLYLAFLAISALILLYVHLLQTWTMFSRFFAIFIVPSFIFVGFGLEKIIDFFRSRFNLKQSVVLTILCLFILACSLPKNLMPRETDKLIFKEIGELIADREGNDKEIQVATSLHLIRWISFYANLNYRGAPCPEKNYDIENIIGKSYEEFVQNLRRRGIRYFLWEEKHWPKGSFHLVNREDPKDFIKLGNWSHPDTGRLILFRVI